MKIQKKRLIWAIKVLFLWCIAPTLGALAADMAISLRGDADWQVQLRQAVSAPFGLTSITYSSDVALGSQEFEYLVGIKEGMTVQAGDLECAVARLFEKKLFERIDLTLTDSGAGKAVHMQAHGVWRLAKLKFHGMLIGKEKYRQYYLMEPGDPFDEGKHQRSLERIRESFSRGGYFEGAVNSELVRDEHRKLVTVHVSLWQGPRFRVGDITVKRAHESDDTDEIAAFDYVRKAVHKRLARKYYSKEQITTSLEAIKRSLAKKGFLHLGITLSEKIRRSTRTVDITLTFDFLEKRQFVFFGNSFFTDEQLHAFFLEQGDAVHMIPAAILAEDLEKEYHKKGFFGVRIETQEEQGRNFFIIHEGERCVIDQVDIEGAVAYSQRFLIRSFFKSMVGEFFDLVDLDECRARLVAWYHAHGYLDVAVTKCERIERGPESPHHYTLQLVVHEGPQMILAAIKIPGFESLEADQWFIQSTGRLVNRPCNPKSFDEQRDWLRRQLRSQGYSRAVVKTDFDRNGNQLTVVWCVDKGEPAAFFGKTVIQGCSRLPFDVIERSLAYREGEPWDETKLKRSVERLRKLGIFESVHLSPAKIGAVDQSKDLLLKLYEDDPFEVRFRSGLGLQAVDRYFNFERGMTYKLGGTFLFKNPTNAGDCFSLDGDLARSIKHLDIEYMRPHLFGIPSATRMKGYVSSYAQPGFIGSKKDLYDIAQQGFLMGAREKWHNWDVGLNLGFEFMCTKMKQDSCKLAAQVAQAINFKYELLGKTLPYFFVEPVVVIDRLDEKMNPSFGTFTLCTMKGMFSVCDRWHEATFMKVMGEHSIFYPLTPFLVGAFHLRLGHIFFQKFQDIMPFERFYLGGANSIRSYEADLCPPICSFKDDAGNCYTVPQGGKTMAHVNLELRFPLFKSIKGVVFQDLGTLIGQSLSEFDSSRLLAATGFGLRYNTPVGPLRFDIGWKWRLSHPQDYAYSWFLALGHAF